MKFSCLNQNIISPLLGVAMASTSLGLFTRPALAGWEWQGGMDSLISEVIIQASKTLGAYAGVPMATYGWCEGRTAYYPSKMHICFDPLFMRQMAGVGDGAVAYVAAHEYAHHIQLTSRKFAFGKDGLSTLQTELQADCFAGFILGAIPNVYFDSADVQEMLYAASLIGDKEYDTKEHHGSGDNRALALRSGFRLAVNRVKDNYYKLFCGQN